MASQSRFILSQQLRPKAPWHMWIASGSDLVDFTEQASWSFLRPGVINSRVKDHYWKGVIQAEEEAIQDSPAKFQQTWEVLLCHMSAIDIF